MKFFVDLGNDRKERKTSDPKCPVLVVAKGFGETFSRYPKSSREKAARKNVVCTELSGREEGSSDERLLGVAKPLAVRCGNGEEGIGRCRVNHLLDGVRNELVVSVEAEDVFTTRSGDAFVESVPSPFIEIFKTEEGASGVRAVLGCEYLGKSETRSVATREDDFDVFVGLVNDRLKSFAKVFRLTHAWDNDGNEFGSWTRWNIPSIPVP